jgi:hypothetical protein
MVESKVRDKKIYSCFIKFKIFSINRDINDKIGYFPAVYLKQINNEQINSITSSKFLSKIIESKQRPTEQPSTSKSLEKNEDNHDNDDDSFNEDFEINNDVYYAIEDYIDTSSETLSLKKGQKIQVIDKENTNGWWYVKNDLSNSGWTPSEYLSVSFFLEKLN